jgi:hypothetical protein
LIILRHADVGAPGHARRAGRRFSALAEERMTCSVV